MTAFPQPPRVNGPEAWINALAHLQETTDAHRELVERLHKILEPQQAPGRLHPVKLNSARPYSDAAADHGSKSFSVFNPLAIAVALGSGGVGASNVAAVTVPPRSALTLPVTAENLEVGPANPADLQAGGAIGVNVDAWVFVITYQHVQPFFFGSWPG